MHAKHSLALNPFRHLHSANMSVNWVMLTPDGKDIVPLENETTFYRQDGVRFELDSSNGGYPGAG